MCKRKPLGSVKRVCVGRWKTNIEHGAACGARGCANPIKMIGSKKMKPLRLSRDNAHFAVFQLRFRVYGTRNARLEYFVSLLPSSFHVRLMLIWRCLSKQSKRFLCVRHGFLVDSLECVFKWANLEADDTKKPNNNIIRLSISRIKLNLTIITVITLELR